MTTDIEQYLRITIEQAAADLAQAERAIGQDNVVTAVELNLSAAFANFTEAGLIEWRRGNSPVPAFNRAIDAARRAAAHVRRARAQIDEERAAQRKGSA